MRNKGFTLLEVIIVIIIVGVLASLALPRYFLVIEHARAVEAVGNLKLIREGLERCFIMNNRDQTKCNYYGDASFAKLELDNLNQLPNGHFQYSWTTTYSGESYAIMAQRNEYELSVHGMPYEIPCGPGAGGGSGTDSSGIMLCYRDQPDQIQIEGYGVYQGMKW